MPLKIFRVSVLPVGHLPSGPLNTWAALGLRLVFCSVIRPSGLASSLWLLGLPSIPAHYFIRRHTGEFYISGCRCAVTALLFEVGLGVQRVLNPVSFFPIFTALLCGARPGSVAHFGFLLMCLVP